MSDKTKMLADQKREHERIVKWLEWMRDNPPFVPTCWCGETKDVYACSSWHKTEYYCEKHLPEEWR